MTKVRSPLAILGTEPANTVTYEYDERGLLYLQTRAIEDPSKKLVTRYDYDYRGRMRYRWEDPLAAAPQRKWELVYDAAGRFHDGL